MNVIEGKEHNGIATPVEYTLFSEVDDHRFMNDAYGSSNNDYKIDLFDDLINAFGGAMGSPEEENIQNLNSFLVTPSAQPMKPIVRQTLKCALEQIFKAAAAKL